MKMSRTGLKIGVGLAGLVFLVGGSLFVRMEMEKATLKPAATGKVTEGITAVQDGFSNLYVWEKNGQYLVVDAAGSAEAVRRELESLGIDPLKVSALLLTHSDYDHVGAVELFPQAAVYLPREEEAMITGQIPRLAFFTNSLERPHLLLDDGSERQIGPWKVRTITLPGHTVGSSAYLIDEAYLFTGDSIGKREGTWSAFNDFYNMDTPLLRASLQKLLKYTGIKMVLTAHYGVSADYEGLISELKDNL